MSYMPGGILGEGRGGEGRRGGREGERGRGREKERETKRLETWKNNGPKPPKFDGKHNLHIRENQ